MEVSKEKMKMIKSEKMAKIKWRGELEKVIGAKLET